MREEPGGLSAYNLELAIRETARAQQVPLDETLSDILPLFLAYIEPFLVHPEVTLVDIGTVPSQVSLGFMAATSAEHITIALKQDGSIWVKFRAHGWLKFHLSQLDHCAKILDTLMESILHD